MIRQKIPHNNVYAENIFKGNVNLENDILWVKPDVPFFLTREILNFLNTEVKVIYWDGEDLARPKFGNKLDKNSYNKRLINKNDLIHTQKYKYSNKRCDYYQITNIDHIVPKHYNYEIKIRNEPYTHALIGYNSFEKISEQIMNNFNAKSSRQTILKFHRKTDSNLKIRKKRS
ncbi:MAG: hypothetical protein LBB45_09330 [Methanobrevibacter sp.]|jgi:hypothetical protein|nr:hypothetical protein [Candidatus Methanovirga basalitermitum]